jgi:hypothetical protein
LILGFLYSDCKYLLLDIESRRCFAGILWDVKALVAAIAALALSAPAAGGTAPTLRLVRTSPVVVAGSHFRAGERVTVTLVVTKRIVRHVTASQTGSFTIGYGGIQLGHCAGFSLSAVGSAGSRAVVKLPQPACMPARSPGGAIP